MMLLYHINCSLWCSSHTTLFLVLFSPTKSFCKFYLSWRSSILKCSNNEVSSSSCPSISQILRNSSHYSHLFGPTALLSFQPLILPPHLRSSNSTVYSSLHTFIHPDNLLILVFTLPHRIWYGA